MPTQTRHKISMTIEEAIEQKRPFKNELQRGLVNLMYTSNYIRDKMRHHMKPYDITTQQYNVLRILRGAGKPISTSVIRKRLLDKMSDASRMVDRLVQKGFVERATCSSDKRLVDVSITEEGRALLAKIDTAQESLGSAMGALTEEEAKYLNDLLDKIRM